MPSVHKMFNDGATNSFDHTDRAGFFYLHLSPHHLRLNCWLHNSCLPSIVINTSFVGHIWSAWFWYDYSSSHINVRTRRWFIKNTCLFWLCCSQMSWEFFNCFVHHPTRIFQLAWLRNLPRSQHSSKYWISQRNQPIPVLYLRFNLWGYKSSLINYITYLLHFRLRLSMISMMKSFWRTF